MSKRSKKKPLDLNKSMCIAMRIILFILVKKALIKYFRYRSGLRQNDGGLSFWT